MTISVVIPTFNEAGNIADLVTFIRQSGRKEVVEIIVVHSGSTDTTRAQAKESGALVLVTKHRSRANQMNLGSRHARGEVLYFIHADVKLLPSFVDDIKESMDQGFRSGCYRYIFNSDKLLLKINAYFTRTIMEGYDFISRLRKRYAFGIIQKI